MSTGRAILHALLRRFTFAAVLLTSCLPIPALAQGRLSRDRSKTGEALLRAFRPVTTEVARSTVRILTTVEENESKSEREAALGAIVSADGLVLTKASQLPKEVLCRFSNGRTVKAERIAANPELDLALLKVDAADLTPLAWSEAEIAVGQWLATATQGELPAAIGVVSVRTRSIPRERAVLGVSVSDVDKGAKVMEIIPDSAAVRAGVKEGDVILEVGGKEIRNGSDLADRVSSFRAGETVPLKLLRAEKTVELEATLTRRPSEPSNRGLIQNQLGGELSTRRDGFPSAIQHDTVLRPEDCGGPVVGLDGKPLGLNIARAGRTESYALPASVLVPALEELKRQAGIK